LLLRLLLLRLLVFTLQLLIILLSFFVFYSFSIFNFGNCFLFLIFDRINYLRFNKILLIIILSLMLRLLPFNLFLLMFFLSLLILNFFLAIFCILLFNSILFMIIFDKQLSYDLIRIKTIHTLLKDSINEYNHFWIWFDMHWNTKVMILFTIYLKNCDWPSLFLT